MTKMATKDPVNQRGFETQARIGETKLGVLKNWEWYDDPKRLLFSMSRYKFVSKLLDGRQNVLEVGCGDAFNAPIVRQTVRRLTVSDFDPVFIEDARARMKDRWAYDAVVVDALADEIPGAGSYDAIYSLDVLEHIPPDQEHVVIGKLARALTPDGVAIIGMPSLESQVYANAASKAGHVNCKTSPELKALMQTYFHSVFMFAMNDEVVHTGFHKMAHYIIAVASHRR
jgi:2-polyprenyl-3-methyl-5-hydroxy-6-metoxy-1,4-benzoquinol methylase